MPTKKTKKRAVSVKRNGKILYGAVAQNILKKRAAKKRAAKANPNPATKKAASKKRATKRNAAAYSPDAPIKVTQHFRSGGPGYATARERIIRQGQRDLFAPDASMDQLLSFLRKNPTVIDAVRKKLGAAKFATASPSLLKKTMREVIADARGKKSNPRYAVTGLDAEGREADLGILTGPNKTQVVARAQQIYGKAGYSKIIATQSDKSDFIGRQAFFPKKRTRRNPDGELYETFTGAEHTGHESITAPTGAPRNLDELGDLVEFKWVDNDGHKYTVNLEQQGVAAKLAAHQYADGRQELFLVSAPGKPLPNFRDYLPHGNHGHIYEVTYRAQKSHLGDTTPQLYYHRLGEETGNPPVFHVNKDGELIFKGGEYWITERGIHN